MENTLAIFLNSHPFVKGQTGNPEYPLLVTEERKKPPPLTNNPPLFEKFLKLSLLPPPLHAVSLAEIPEHQRKSTLLVVQGLAPDRTMNLSRKRGKTTLKDNPKVRKGVHSREIEGKTPRGHVDKGERGGRSPEIPSLHENPNLPREDDLAFSPLHKMKDVLNLAPGNVPEGSANLPKELPHKPWPLWGGNKEHSVKGYASSPMHLDKGETLFLPQSQSLLGVQGKPGQRLHSARVYLLKQRKDTMANPVAEETQVEVGTVLNERDTLPLKELPDLAAPYPKERPHIDAFLWSHAAKAQKAGTPDDVHENRLRLVIKGMP